MNLRPYQQSAYDATMNEFGKGIHSTLATMPTGCGKTVYFAHVANHFAGRGRVMVLAHREELIYQAANKIEAVTGEKPEIEMADQAATVPTESFGFTASRFIVSSIQTQMASRREKKRMHRFDPSHFSLLIVDEAHHSAAPSYRQVIDHYKQNEKLCILGVTATGDRSDGEGLGCVFESIAYKYELPDAVHEGWLVPIRQRSVIVDGLDFSKCRTLGGDFNQADLAAAMEFESALHPVVHASLERACGFEPGTLVRLKDDPDRQQKIAMMLNGRIPRKALVFAVSVAQAERTAEIFNRWLTGCAKFVCGETPKQDRRALLADYAAKRFQILVNVGVATEGFDDPGIELVVMARPTKSRSLCCLDASTEILTRRGWMGPDDIRDDDEAATFNYQNGYMAWSQILSRIDRPMGAEERMYGIQSPALDIRVTDQHDMLCRLVEGRNARRTEWRKITAHELAERNGDYELCCAGVSPANQENGGLPLTDDEIRFIGWVMTDGTISKSSKGIVITQAEHQPWIADIESCLNGCGFKFSKRIGFRKNTFATLSRTIRWGISKGIPRATGKHLRGWGALEEYIDKDFSCRLEGLNRRQFGILLETLHLGDGQKQEGQSWTRRSYHIASRRKLFVDRLQSLCVRRGWRCNVSTENRKGRPFYYAHIKNECIRFVGGQTAKDRPTFRLMPHVPGERVWCIQTLHGTLVSRRNGKVAILGNCQMLGRGTRPLEEIAHMLGELSDPSARRAMIEASAKTHVEILDFVGNSGKHRLITAADILAGDGTEESVVDRAKEIAQAETIDVQAALEQALMEAEEDAQVNRLIAEHEAAKLAADDERWAAIEAAQRRAQLVATSEYRIEEVGHDLYGGNLPVRTVANRRDGATPKQIAFLVNLGIQQQKAATFSVRQAGAVIDKLKSERCTTKQAKFLRRSGYSEADIADMNFDRASAAIDQAMNGQRGAA